MRITVPSKVKSRIWIEKNIRTEILKLLGSRIEKSKEFSVDDEEIEFWENLFNELMMTAEGFDVSFKKIPYIEVDRKCSMLSGPFFTTVNYPVPVNSSKVAMTPLVQFDLQYLSEALHENIGDGLLQLWFDLAGKNELIRIIPKDVLNTEEPTPFCAPVVSVDDLFPLPIWFESDPVNQGVSVVRGLTSYGIDGGGIVCDEIDGESDQWIKTLLYVFNELTSKNFGKGNVQAGGSLQTIQYNQTDVKMRQLLRFADWGSSGSAEIFFQTNKDKATKFSFWSSLN